MQDRFQNVKNEKETPRVLVCVLGETRTWKLAWPSFKANVLDTLQADLALCIGVNDAYDRQNPFWQVAKYHWTSVEYEDFGVGFDEAQTRLIKTGPKPIWRKLLSVKDQWLGGIKDKEQHLGSGGILIYLRWLLLESLKSSGALQNYDRFIITRSDFMWLSPHPSLDLLTPDAIWFPNGEHYGGFTDRHVVLTRDDVELYLNLLKPIVCETDRLLSAMAGKSDWNLESYIKHHINAGQGLSRVKFFPYIMYCVREREGHTRWAKGFWNRRQNCYIKYPSEYAAALFWTRAMKRCANQNDLLSTYGELPMYILELADIWGRKFKTKIRLADNYNALPKISCVSSGQTAYILQTSYRDMIILQTNFGSLISVDKEGRLLKRFLGLKLKRTLRLLAKSGIPAIVSAIFGYRLLSIKPYSGNEQEPNRS